MTKLRLLLAFLGILCFVVSCSNGVENTVLYDSTCQAPCWRGIDMGATKEETINKLKIMPDIDETSITISRTDRPYMEEVINWKYKGSKGYGNIIIIGNKVAYMYFPLEKELPLASLEKLYGEPGSIIAKKERLEGTLISIYLFYRQKGICLKIEPAILPFLNPDTYKVTRSTQVSAVYYSNPTIQDGQIKYGCLAGLDDKVFDKLKQEWTGFGNYNIYDMSRKE